MKKKQITIPDNLWEEVSALAEYYHVPAASAILLLMQEALDSRKNRKNIFNNK